MTDNLPVVFLSCKVFQNLLEKYVPDSRSVQFIYLDYGLHSVPRNLKKAVQEQINQIDQPSLILLGYGLCGNGLDGIQAGKHLLVIPRVDDCIAIFLGSYEEYRRQFDATPGTYYLSKGWLESGSTPLKEYGEYVERYGIERAGWIMDTQYHHYARLAFVAQAQSDLDQYREDALEVAEYCRQWGMRYEEIMGSERYIQRMAQVAFKMESAGDEFIVVPPGETLTQNRFIR